MKASFLIDCLDSNRSGFFVHEAINSKAKLADRGGGGEEGDISRGGWIERGERTEVILIEEGEGMEVI